MNIDGEGGQAHAGSLNRNVESFIRSGAAVHAPHLVVEAGILKVILRDELGPQGVAGQQDSRGDRTLRCTDVNAQLCSSVFRFFPIFLFG